MSHFHKHDNENLYEFLSCEIIGAKDGFEPSSYRDISYTIFHWKYFAQYLIVGMVRYHQFESHAYRRILLSVSSRAANYAPHRLTMLHGELSATSPAHHRMAINHLLQRFCMMPFLGLVATHWRKVWLLLKELWTLLSAFLQRVSLVLDFSKCGQVGHEPTGSAIFSS